MQAGNPPTEFLLRFELPNMAKKVILPPEDSAASSSSRLAGWWHETDDGERIICDLCPRGCVLKPGDRGFCFVRENRGGQMVLDHLRPQHGFLHRSGRKKTPQPFLSRHGRAVFRHGGLQSGLRLLPELDDVAVAQRRGRLRNRRSAEHRRRRRAIGLPRTRPSPTTIRSSRAGICHRNRQGLPS